MLAPANPPDGSVKETEVVLGPVHAGGIEPDPSVKVSVKLLNNCVGSEIVRFQLSILTMTAVLPVDWTVMGAAPFTDGTVVFPPVVSQNTNIATLLAASRSAETEPSLWMVWSCEEEDLVEKVSGVVVG